MILAMAPPDSVRFDAGRVKYVLDGVAGQIAPVYRPTDKGFVAYRKNKSFAVWDARGLTIRTPGRVTSTRLPEFAPDGRGAEALSGSARVKGHAYFLLRYPKGEERLVRVNLDAARPTVEPMGELDARSLAQGPLSNRLFLYQGKLALFGNAPDGWGLATFEPSTKRRSFRKVGDGRLQSLADRSGIYVERFPTFFRAGILNRDTWASRPLQESPLPIEIVDDGAPALLRTDGQVRNAYTGATMRVSDTARLMRKGPLLAIVEATKVSLYDLTRGRFLTSGRR